MEVRRKRIDEEDYYEEIEGIEHPTENSCSDGILPARGRSIADRRFGRHEVFRSLREGGRKTRLD
jgi:hypothetical protein